MDYHGIKMKGPFIGQKVSSLPTWTNNDIGRTVYLTTNNKRYYGNNVGWTEPEVDKIWTYQNIAPTGWSIIYGTSDALLATKGGSRSYNTTGETQAGTWTQPSHILTTSQIPQLTTDSDSHNHTYPHVYFSYGTNYSKNGNRGPGDIHQGGSNTNLGVDIMNDDSHSHIVNAGGGSSHNHGNEYRPTANVGIIIERNT